MHGRRTGGFLYPSANVVFYMLVKAVSPPLLPPPYITFLLLPTLVLILPTRRYDQAELAWVADEGHLVHTAVSADHFEAESS